MFLEQQGDGWHRSLRIMVAKQGGTWDRSAKTMATFSALNALPGPRHALRRFYENNAKVITTVPKDRLVVIDYTEQDSQKGLAK
jgi:hypothetical protein